VHQIDEAVAGGVERVLRQATLPQVTISLVFSSAVYSSAQSTWAAISVRDRRELIFVLVYVQICVLLTKHNNNKELGEQLATELTYGAAQARCRSEYRSALAM
jgi:hypothetical protein